MGLTTVTPKNPSPIAYWLLGAPLLASIVLEVGEHSTGYWQLAFFALAPDLTLLYGAGGGLARGRLRTRDGFQRR